jgi:hypothetical protein
MPAKLDQARRDESRRGIQFELFLRLSVSLGRDYSGMPVIPAVNLALAARIIKLAGHAVKAICSGEQQTLSPGILA